MKWKLYFRDIEVDPALTTFIHSRMYHSARSIRETIDIWALSRNTRHCSGSRVTSSEGKNPPGRWPKQSGKPFLS